MTTATGGQFDRRLMPPMILGAVLNPISSSIIAVALVPISLAFGASAWATTWLVSSLYLATSVGQPLVGRLVDTFGPRRLYLIGTTMAGIAGVIGALAPDLGVLVVARVILGFGTCAGYPAAMYLIRSEAKRTGQDSPGGILTALAVSSQTIAVIGPTLGGLLIGVGGWRTTFAINVPLAIACIILGAIRLPHTPTTGGFQVLRKLDYAGILLFTSTLVTLLLFLMGIRPANAYLLAIAVAAGTGFAFRELRCADPFIDIRVLGGNRPLLFTFARNFLGYTVSYGFIYGFTQWLEDGRGLSASVAGIVLIPMFAVAILVSSLTGRRKEIRVKLLVGLATQIVACALLLFLGGSSAIWMLLVVALVVGVPQALNSLANQNAVYYQADPARLGASSGLLRTFTYLGAIVASATSGAFYGQRASTQGLHELAIFLLVVAALFFALTLIDRSLQAATAARNIQK
ncbi:MFS transporter [Curtobacterium sp. ISL-83]|uniref:MFS transporter n=1 Tax=Curtobacterium sp. ISL-83 TaxID=2819145 RepID=UPI001BE97060|nr:MFS transporter [Curtobacterium sp. ISL-83]MBT2504273.1 MFS transporter [Curtobacterium sp. ISL-83]